MLNKTNTKMENVNYKREEAYLYNKKEKADKKELKNYGVFYLRLRMADLLFLLNVKRSLIFVSLK